jgi:hypothetical protein
VTLKYGNTEEFTWKYAGGLDVSLCAVFVFTSATRKSVTLGTCDFYSIPFGRG